MALIHLKKEQGKWVAYGYGTLHRADTPVGAYIGLKVFRAYLAGLICSKYPMERTRWASIMVESLAKKYSHLNKLLNEQFSIKRMTI